MVTMWGGKVIKNFSALLKAHFADVLVARVGGLEFELLSESALYANNIDCINDFRLVVANQKFCAKEHLLPYTGSMGLRNTLVKNLDQMFVSANKHLYKANNSGRNQMPGVIR